MTTDPFRLVTLLTDFGTQDPFVGIMKGVIADIIPTARLIDLSHDIPPGDIRRASIQLWQARDYFPAGTIFLCVIDPGVGTSRKGIAFKSGNHYYVGPDNGLFSLILSTNSKIYELANPDYQLKVLSSTFHGRDIFAPAAGHIAAGVPIDHLGNRIDAPIALPKPLLQISTTAHQNRPGAISVTGEILYPDRFGNLLTSLGKIIRQGSGLHLTSWVHEEKIAIPSTNIENCRLLLDDGGQLNWVSTFAEIPPGECAVLIGSTGLLEIAARGTSAADILGLTGGERIVLHIQTDL